VSQNIVDFLLLQANVSFVPVAPSAIFGSAAISGELAGAVL
jgi:hypothetical protein